MKGAENCAKISTLH